MRRPMTWDECWMSVALVVAQRSKCVLFQAGAVIVSPANKIVATGYNGPPANLASERFLGRGATCQDDCPRAQTGERTPSYGGGCISVHAEANALMLCDRQARDSATLYVNGVSCLDCAKLVSNSGVARVVCVDDHQEHRPLAVTASFYRRAGLQADIMEPADLALILR